jgi:hypothetical protein
MEAVYSVTDKVKIKNEMGTSQRPSCNCGSWLAHWEKYSKQRGAKCSVDGCNEKATVGAHVTRPAAKNEDYKTHSYIVPMCATHNGKHGEIFNSKNTVSFVWANVQGTCGS